MISTQIPGKRICIVAILKNEETFIDEWLAYHRLIGVNHFFLYDDDELHPLAAKLTRHADYVTVVNWAGNEGPVEGKNNQTRAYTHAFQNFCNAYEWVAFIDGDEFIVLPGWHDDIHLFLNDFEYADAILLNWHVFGHSGYYNDPPAPITAHLTRRLSGPGINYKSITRTKSIISIENAHFCHIHYGIRVDANHKKFHKDLYPNKSQLAHINHYQCRSFKRWMSRLDRGDVNFKLTNTPNEHKWRIDYELCLKQFVTTVAKDKNEYVDEYMLKFKDDLMAGLYSKN